MNQTFAAVAALSLTMILWGFGRKPPKGILKNIDASFGAKINHNQQSLVQIGNAKRKNEATLGSSEGIENWQLPKTAIEKLELKKQLKKAMKGNPEMRLKAIQISKLWNDPIVLPLIKLGLRDSDSRVVLASAEALERYRGKPKKACFQESSPPRNVARMR